jgi:hypothetical protein
MPPLPSLIVPEILEQLNEISLNDDQRIAILRKFNKPSLQAILRLAFDGAVVIGVKDFPKYTPDPAPIGYSQNSLDMEYRRFYLFCEPDWTRINRKGPIILIQILESVHETEAKLLVNALKRNLKIRGLTAQLVQKAFPGLLKKPILNDDEIVTAYKVEEVTAKSFPVANTATTVEKVVETVQPETPMVVEKEPETVLPPTVAPQQQQVQPPTQHKKFGNKKNTKKDHTVATSPTAETMTKEEVVS